LLAQKHNYFSSPLGEIEIKHDDNFIYSISFNKESEGKKTVSKTESEIAKEAEKQLSDYFNGALKHFDLPLYIEGTQFQKKVWTQLIKIEFGTTQSYLQLAKNLGDAKCIRAAASANGKNPFAIVIPCHRVIGTNGSLTGYAGELWRKKWLLEHEAKIAGVYQMLF
jgi:methylated-DNA-[protein]-cysteine S-methyltransferase